MVVAGAKAREFRIGIVYASRETEGLKTWVRAVEQISEGIIIELLPNFSVDCVNDQPWAAQRVGNDPVGIAAPDHLRRAAGIGIHEYANDTAHTVKLRNRAHT